MEIHISVIYIYFMMKSKLHGLAVKQMVFTQQKLFIKILVRDCFCFVSFSYETKRMTKLNSISWSFFISTYIAN